MNNIHSQALQSSHSQQLGALEAQEPYDQAELPHNLAENSGNVSPISMQSQLDSESDIHLPHFQLINENVDSSHQPDFDSIEPKQPTQTVTKSSLKSKFQRIGRWRITILSLSFILLLASLVYIGWLWSAPSSNNTWVNIVQDRWVTRSATVAAIAIRTAVAAQAVIATSMLAALFLEKRGVRLEDAAEFSITRYSNSGPLLSLLAFVQNSRNVRGIIYFSFILLFALVTTALQFTSTILLTDVQEGLLLGRNTNTKVASGQTHEGFLHNINYWSMTPGVFASFLEYSNPVEPIDGVADTGISVRGFLPINNQSSRANLRFYDGIASLFDTRIVCSRPNISFTQLGLDTIQVPIDDGEVTVPIYNLYLQGQMTNNLKMPELVYVDNPINFDCSSQILDGESSPSFQICQLGRTSGDQVAGLISRLNPTNVTSDQYMIATDNNITSWVIPENLENDGSETRIGHSYLLFDIPIECRTSRSMECANISTNATPNGVWQTYTVTTSSNLRVSVCYDAIYPYSFSEEFWLPHDYNISISTTELPEEPTIEIDSSSQYFNTSSIRNQLGATNASVNQDPLQRGIIPLEIELIDAQRTVLANYNSTQPSTFGLPTFPFIWADIWSGLPENMLWLAINSTDTGTMPQNTNMTGINPVLGRIFVDTLTDTNNPAIALQALWTSILRSAYYDALPFFDFSKDTTERSVSQQQMPRSNRGLTAVVVLVTAHWIMTMAVLVMFVSLGQVVVLNSSWAVVLDVSSQESYALLSEPEYQRCELQDITRDGETNVRKTVRLVRPTS